MTETMWALRVGDEPGLCGAYDDNGHKLSDLALFRNAVSADVRRGRIRAFDDMTEVRVVRVRVTFEEVEQAPEQPPEGWRVIEPRPELAEGMMVWIRRPGNPDEGPCWPKAMDALDGAVVDLREQETPGIWFVRIPGVRPRWLVLDSWVTPVEKQEEK